MIRGPERRLKWALALMATAMTLVLGLGAWVLYRDYSHVEHAAQDEAARNISRITPDLQAALELSLQQSLSVARAPWDTRLLHPAVNHWTDGTVVELNLRQELLHPAVPRQLLRPPEWYLKLSAVERSKLERLETGKMTAEEWKTFRNGATTTPAVKDWVGYQIWLQEKKPVEKIIQEGWRLCDESNADSPSGVPIRELVLLLMVERLVPERVNYADMARRMDSAMERSPSWVLGKVLRAFREPFERGQLNSEWSTAMAKWDAWWSRKDEVSRLVSDLIEKKVRLNGGKAEQGVWVDGLGDDMMALPLTPVPAGDRTLTGSDRDRILWWLISKVRFEEKLDQALQMVSRGLPPSMGLRFEGGGLIRNWPPDRELVDEIAKKTMARREFRFQGDLSAMHFQVSLGVVDPEILYHQYRTRLYWMVALLVVSLGFLVFAIWTVVQAFREQARLQEEQQNFIASVSHELRAPLAAVSLMTENLAGAKVEAAERRADYLQRMLRECRRLSGMVENVLDFSRIQRGRQTYEMEPTDVGAVMEHTVALMRENAERQKVELKLELELSVGLQADWDGRAIHQALINLIDNAIKHSPQNGVVTVKIGLRAEHQVQIRVVDEGPGIPVPERERIFERFHRLGSELRRETPGIGIGLSLVKHVTDAHGGRVWVEATEGKGSCFVMELPLNPKGLKGGAC